MKQNPICIIGFGRLGETLAAILRAHRTVAVYEVNEERRRYAEQQGFRVIAKEDIQHYPTIFLCVPIGHFEAATAELASYISPGSLVMDVCSVKVMPVQTMMRVLPEGVSIIATHPLFGPDSISKGLDKLTIVTYPVRVPSAAYNEWNEFWKTLGLHVVQASPEEHDKTMAYTLGLPHFVGRIMAELRLQPQEMTTFSYNSLYEIMQQTTRDTWQLFHDMQHYNPYCKAMRLKVQQALQTVEAKLDAN
jgi:prephenate dehydrogenase